MPEEAPTPFDFGDPTAEAEEGEPEDDPKESLEAMAQEAEEEAEEEVDEPVSSCPKPWFELTVLGLDDEPLKDAPYKIDLPDVKEEGKLDGQGFLRLEDAEIEPGSYVVKIVSEEGSDGEETRRVEVVPTVKLEEEDLEDSLDPALDTIVPPWDPY